MGQEESRNGDCRSAEKERSTDGTGELGRRRFVGEVNEHVRPSPLLQMIGAGADPASRNPFWVVSVPKRDGQIPVLFLIGS